MKESIIWFVWSGIWAFILVADGRKTVARAKDITVLLTAYAVVLLIMSAFIGFPKTGAQGLLICYGGAAGLFIEGIAKHYSRKGLFNNIARKISDDWQLQLLIFGILLLAGWVFSVFQVNARVLEFREVRIFPEYRWMAHVIGIVLITITSASIALVTISWAEVTTVVLENQRLPLKK